MGLPRWLRSIGFSASGRAVARAEAVLKRIERSGAGLRAASDETLREQAARLRGRARAGQGLDALLVDTYALTREVAARTVAMRPYDEQILGAVLLQRGWVAEMKTGEGKTLVASLPLVLHALSGRGAHLVTVNDYLAARDAAWMGPIYEFMGLSVGVITEDLDPDLRREERQAAYRQDITYVTNQELVFDYLRDNLASDPEELLQRPLHFAVVDEVDLLLLDEARTPLIISGASGDDPGLCPSARKIAASLQEGRHYKVDHKARQVLVHEAGWAAMERALGVDNLADPEHLPWQHALYNAMLAHAVYERDVDYIVDRDDDRVYLIDEHTGRVSEDKRMSNGLHQALEAKEGVHVRGEDRTLAKTSYQMFFALYPGLCGMSGTAWSVREEFQQTYGLKTAVVPTHEPVIRRDLAPVVFRTAAEKFAAVAAEIQRLQGLGRPVLVGTTSVRESEHLAAILSKRGIPHQVLNAKNHDEEAAIIAQAGAPGAVTLSTNMAGRGVDILLGGNAEALAEQGGDQEAVEALTRRQREDGECIREAGGLAVLGTGLHEAQRIDDQLRGRAGRQGDPGSSRYFLSLDDPIYRRFGQIEPTNPTLDRLRERLADQPEGEQVSDSYVISTLEDLRRKVETEHEAARKEVLKYDVVVEQHRKTVYAWRRTLLLDAPEEVEAELMRLPAEVAVDLDYRVFAGEQDIGPEHYGALAEEAKSRFGLELDLGPARMDGRPSPQAALFLLQEVLSARLDEVRSETGAEAFVEVGRQLLLSIIDHLWTEQLTSLERMDEGVGLRAYGQLDPLVEFRREANLLYQEMLREIRLSATAALCQLQVVSQVDDPDDSPLPGGDRPVRKTLKG